MIGYKLIVAIVPNERATIMTEAALASGAPGGTVAMAFGTAKTTFLQILGLCDSKKEVVFIAAKDADILPIKNAMSKSALQFKKPFGVLFTINLVNFFKGGKKMETTITHSTSSPESAKYSLLTFIVNRGLADSAMDAARAAGAQGGTVLNARGTAKPGDSKFFGLEIVPEKEMIFILTQKQSTQKIIDAVTALECFKKKGSGVSFTIDAEDFTLLGK